MWGEHPESLRRIRHLIAGLPRDSAFFRSAYPEVANWTQTHELLAMLIEVTDQVHLRHLGALGTKRLPKAISITRPNVKPKPKRKATAEDIKKMFGGSVRYVPKEVSDA